VKVGGVAYRSIWLEPDGRSVGIIDQTALPHGFVTLPLTDLAGMCHAIRTMQLRGAPLIGAAAAYGMALALASDASAANLERAASALLATRPTAVNLRWAVEALRRELAAIPEARRGAAAYARAEQIAEEDVATNRAIGRHGLPLIRAAFARKSNQGPVNILTHCNAGWLATVDWGTALAPVFAAQEAGLPVHVWVDETRPRNQGAFLTAWELNAAGVPHTVIADNAGGHLMRKGEVDLCFVGTDRTTARGDVANKIGTYLKALAAKDNGIPFYVCLPSPTIDWTIESPDSIPIEERAGTEVSHIAGLTADGAVVSVRLVPEGSPVANPAFDVTPARLVTGLVTERGVAEASREGLLALFPERSGAAA